VLINRVIKFQVFLYDQPYINVTPDRRTDERTSLGQYRPMLMKGAGKNLWICCRLPIPLAVQHDVQQVNSLSQQTDISGVWA